MADFLFGEETTTDALPDAHPETLADASAGQENPSPELQINDSGPAGGDPVDPPPSDDGDHAAGGGRETPESAGPDGEPTGEPAGSGAGAEA
ncbi:hypothetical protein [Anaeromyxobacter paludicola]|uniref:hypothetical protein n=1 Tax=Anaeromyxobacter paludicola TaxID=2918171 RepID=UPI0020BE4B99|nr:hypothetical protein [Anaeromyxobacter paludicola]